MTEMTSREILEAIDRAMKEVAAAFATKAATGASVCEPETELAGEPTPFRAPGD